MTPIEWNDWVIGGRDKELDRLEANLHAAVANGMVQGGKRLTGMYNELKERRYDIRGQKDEFLREKEREKRQRRNEREAFKRGSAKFFNQLGG